MASFDGWLERVHERVVDQRAFGCVYSPEVLLAWYEHGFPVRRVAGELNRRWVVKRQRELRDLKVSKLDGE